MVAKPQIPAYPGWMTKTRAAAYMDMSPQKFDQLGIKPKRLCNGLWRYKKHDLDTVDDLQESQRSDHDWLAEFG